MPNCQESSQNTLCANGHIWLQTVKIPASKKCHSFPLFSVRAGEIRASCLSKLGATVGAAPNIAYRILFIYKKYIHSFSYLNADCILQIMTPIVFKSLISDVLAGRLIRLYKVLFLLIFTHTYFLYRHIYLNVLWIESSSSWTVLYLHSFWMKIWVLPIS